MPYVFWLGDPSPTFFTPSLPRSQCPNTCGVFYQRALDRSVQKLQTSLTGNKQRLNAETEAKQLIKIMNDKVSEQPQLPQANAEIFGF